MLVLQVLILVIAWASAIYGIWSEKNINKKVAWTATIITSAGLLTGIMLTVLDFGERKYAAMEAELNQKLLQEKLNGLVNENTLQRQRAETQLQQLRLALTGTELSTLEIRWEFDSVPLKVMNVFVLSRAMEHSRIESDDDLRDEGDGMAALRRAWLIGDVLQPVINMLTTGTTDLKQLYSGDVDWAIGAFSDSTTRAVNDEDGNWPDVFPEGSRYDILFPLNVQYTSALALGKVGDDPVRHVEDERGYEGYKEKTLNYGFHAGIEQNPDGFTMTWKYDMASLERATAGIKKNSASLPLQFNFLAIADTSFQSYIDIMKGLALDNSTGTDDVEKWIVHSKLTVIPNNIPEAAVIYNVERLGLYERVVEYTKQEDPVRQFQYILFKATVKQ